MNDDDALSRLRHLRDDFSARAHQQGNPGWRETYQKDAQALDHILTEWGERNKRLVLLQAEIDGLMSKLANDSKKPARV